MITTLVRFSYLKAWEPAKTPSDVLKYSACLLIPKTDTKGIEAINAETQAAIEVGIEKGKFKRAHVGGLKLPLRDGDVEIENGTRGDEYKGMFFINCSSEKAPGIVKAQKNGPPVPIVDPDEFYSGCYGRADINFFPYNQAGNRGIGVGLNNLLLVKEGERLDGRQSAESAFSSFTDEDVDDSSEGMEQVQDDLV